jgi:uncharacterized lipoprotein YmbA
MTAPRARRVPWPAAVAIAVALAGCSSPPPDYFHTLRGAAPAPAPAAGARAAGPVLGIGPVTVPASLERLAWIVREGDTGARIYEHQLWTQDLSDEIAQALADDLDAGPGAPSRPWADPQPPAVLLHPTIAPPGALRVRVQVLRFESRLAPAPAVRDALRWTLECGTSDDTGWHALRSTVREAGESAGAAASGGDDPGARFDGLAAAHARVVALVADDIAQAVSETAAERAQACAAAQRP